MRRSYILYTLAFALITLNCASVPPENEIENKSRTAENRYETWDSKRHAEIDYSDWRSSVEERYDLFNTGSVPHWVYNNIPLNNTPVFLGVSYPHADIEEEHRKAVQYAAEQALRYKELIGYAHSVYVDSSAGEYFADEIVIHFREDELSEMIENMRIISEYRDLSGTYLLADFPGMLPSLSFPQIPAQYSLDINKPLPRVPGYHIALGISRRYLRLSDTLIHADEMALHEIFYQKHVHVTSQHDTVGREKGLRSHYWDRYEYSTGRFSGFYILARWKEGEYYYSLAIAPE